ncbi:ABC transporter ATP-binding protein [Lederbergia galactosidilytica]|uniref:ATP-binding cassette domain-containing protein n=1 Tax=Lederbergia galactosidilytica TaxID=217031 RepID=UPI0007DB4122|nr:ABC transporter ATP-binding protein [Lederbergia galactosidilytica]
MPNDWIVQQVCELHLLLLLMADDGSVYIHEKLAKEYKTKEFAKTLAMLPQSKGMLPDLTVRELVSFGRAPYKRLLSKRFNNEDKNIIDEVMEMSNTMRLSDRMFHSLSGVEQQKVRIAMALGQNYLLGYRTPIRTYGTVTAN